MKKCEKMFNKRISCLTKEFRCLTKEFVSVPAKSGLLTKRFQNIEIDRLVAIRKNASRSNTCANYCLLGRLFDFQSGFQVMFESIAKPKRQTQNGILQATFLTLVCVYIDFRSKNEKSPLTNEFHV